MPSLSQPVDQVGEVAASGHRKVFFFSWLGASLIQPLQFLACQRQRQYMMLRGVP